MFENMSISDNMAVGYMNLSVNLDGPLLASSEVLKMTTIVKEQVHHVTWNRFVLFLGMFQFAKLEKKFKLLSLLKKTNQMMHEDNIG